MQTRTSRSFGGQSIVETVVGIIFLVPIVLFLFDLAVVVMANTANDNLAKSVARAAASAKDATTSEGTASAGFNAAQQAAGNFAESGIIAKPGSGSFLTACVWNGTGTQDTNGSWPNAIPKPGIGDVGVVTSMTVKLPAPFPFLPNSVDFQAKAVEPIVSIAATASGIGGTPVPISGTHPPGGVGGGADAGGGVNSGGGVGGGASKMAE